MVKSIVVDLVEKVEYPSAERCSPPSGEPGFYQKLPVLAPP